MSELTSNEKLILQLVLRDGLEFSKAAERMNISVEKASELYKTALCKFGTLKNLIKAFAELGIIKPIKFDLYEPIITRKCCYICQHRMEVICKLHHKYVNITDICNEFALKYFLIPIKGDKNE